MTLICVLYVLIGIKLRNSKTLQGITRDSCEINRSISGQTRIIRMLSKYSQSHEFVPCFYTLFLLYTRLLGRMKPTKIPHNNKNTNINAERQKSKDKIIFWKKKKRTKKILNNNSNTHFIDNKVSVRDQADFCCHASESRPLYHRFYVYLLKM